MADISKYQNYAAQMLSADASRNAAFNAYESIVHCNWELPADLREYEGIRKTISTDGQDAVMAGVRVLSSLEPGISYMPLLDNYPNRAKANEIERILKWHLKSANGRRPASIVRDVVRSALIYDEVDCQVVDVDYQIKLCEDLKANASRYKAVQRYGRFMVNGYNPKHVHTRRSNYMPEAVLLCVTKKAREVMAEWGDRAKNLKEAAEGDANVKYYDYCDYDRRVIWVDDVKDWNGVIMDEPTNMPFLNGWISVVGGTNLEEGEEHKRQPILYSMYTSGNWDTLNVLRTIQVYKVIAHGMSPTILEQGPISESTTEISYDGSEPVAKITPGNQAQPMAPPMLDRAMEEMITGFQGQIYKSTVSQILQNADIPAGTAFSTLNLATQTALGALKPAKDLAQCGVREILTQFLLWTKYSGETLYAYGTGKEDNGMNLSLDPDTIDPTAIYIDVDLKPDVPTDRQQRANTAAMAVQQLGYSKESALDDMGVEDPALEMRKGYHEKLLDNQIGLIIAEQQAQLQMKVQEATMQMQMAMQQAQQQMTMPQGGQAPGGGMPTPQAGMNMGGQQMNPALGGQPPAQANPGATFEGATGTARNGMEAPGGEF
jgi:hypothetical protein